MSDNDDYITDEVRDYWIKCKQQGYGDEEIRKMLLEAGWEARVVNQVINSELEETPVKPQEVVGLGGEVSGSDRVSGTYGAIQDPAINKQKRRFSKGLLIGLAVAVLIVGGVLTTTIMASQSKWPLFRAVDKLADLGSVAYEIEVDVEISQEGGARSMISGNTKITSSGEINWRENKVVGRNRGELETGMLGMAKLSIELETITVNENMYLKLTEQMKELIGETETEWVKLDQGAVDQFVQVENEEEMELTEEQRSQIVKAFRQYPIVVAEKNLGIKWVSGKPRVEYALEENKENIPALVGELVRINPSFQVLSDAWLEKLKEVELDGAVEVGLLDGNVYELRLEAARVDQDVSMKVKTQLKLDKHGVEFGVEEPKEYKSLKEILEEQYGQYQSPPDEFGDQFATGRDSQRRTDLYEITNGIYKYAEDNDGDIPGEISVEIQMLGTEEGLLDLSEDLVPKYMARMPYDPVTGSEEESGYYLYLDEHGRIVAEAESEVSGEIIRITR